MATTPRTPSKFNFGQIAEDALGLMPFIINAITAAESLFGSGNGSTKKQLVQSMVQDGLQSYQQIAGQDANAQAIASDVSQAIEDGVKFAQDIGRILPHGQNVGPAGPALAPATAAGTSVKAAGAPPATETAATPPATPAAGQTGNKT